MNLASIIAKTLQNHARQSRGLFRVRHSMRVKQQWQQEMTVLGRAGKTCLLDIRQILFDGPQGRRFHALVTFLIREDYQVWIVPHLAFLQSGLKSFKWSALKQTRPFHPTTAPSRFDLCLSDHRRNDPRADRTLLLTHQTHRNLYADELPLPFAFHPELLDLQEDQKLQRYQEQKRRWLLFFGGGHGRDAYRAVSFFKYLRTVNRHRLLEISSSYFGSRVHRFSNQEHFDGLLEQDLEGFVFADANQFRVPPQSWLNAVSRANFFLAAPGSRYPMSHNCVESLAVGTIPILEYGELFQPALQDGVQCLTYRGEQGLRAALRRAETMHPEEIQRIRHGAIDYYKRHLSGASFVRKIETANASKLHVFPYLARPSQSLLRDAA